MLHSQALLAKPSISFCLTLEREQQLHCCKKYPVCQARIWQNALSFSSRSKAKYDLERWGEGRTKSEFGRKQPDMANFCVYSGSQPRLQVERVLGNCWAPALEARPVKPLLDFSDHQVECRLGTDAFWLLTRWPPNPQLMCCPPWEAVCHDAPAPPALGTAFGPFTFGQRRSKNKSSWRER